MAQATANISPKLADTATPRAPDSISYKQKLIESELDRYTRFPNGCPEQLQKAIRYSLLSSGKRLRPMMVLLAAEACGGKAEAALPAACAVEMIHCYSLIHDDLPSMDNDEVRRGRPTNHKVFGEGVAILAGDALLTLAFEVLAQDIQPAAVAAECCRVLAASCGPRALVGGQCDDLLATPASGTVELLTSIHQRKTGALFLAALRLGGLTAQASDEKLQALAEFGEKLGLAFQITDDLLDHESDSKGIKGGRSKKNQAPKLTFPQLIGIEASNNEVARLVSEAGRALAPLGPSARSLIALASFVSDRL